MKKICCFIIILSLFLSLSCCNAKNYEKITIALEENIYPYCYYSNKENAEARAQNGEYINGIYINFAKKILQSAGFHNVNFIVCTYDKFVDKIKSGEADIFISKRKFEDSEIQKSNAFFYSDLGIMIKPDSNLEKSLIEGSIETDNITVLSDSTEKSLKLPSNVIISNSIQNVLQSINSVDGFCGVICDFQTLRAIKIFSQTELKYVYSNILSLKGETVCHNFYLKKENSSLAKFLNETIDEISVDDMTEIAETEIEVLKKLKKEKII